MSDTIEAKLDAYALACEHGVGEQSGWRAAIVAEFERRDMRIELLRAANDRYLGERDRAEAVLAEKDARIAELETNITNAVREHGNCKGGACTACDAQRWLDSARAGIAAREGK